MLPSLMVIMYRGFIWLKQVIFQKKLSYLKILKFILVHRKFKQEKKFRESFKKFRRLSQIHQCLQQKFLTILDFCFKQEIKIIYRQSQIDMQFFFIFISNVQSVSAMVVMFSQNDLSLSLMFPQSAAIFLRILTSPRNSLRYPSVTS